MPARIDKEGSYLRALLFVGFHSIGDALSGDKGPDDSCALGIGRKRRDTARK